MSVNSHTRSPDSWSEMGPASERATRPIVRHIARDRTAQENVPDFHASPALTSIARDSSVEAQAQQIIDCILADPDPDPRLAAIRHRLRTWVDIYPDFPARALLEHLIETCSQTNVQRWPDSTAAPVIAHSPAPR
ncbi:MAG: hypothetical protein ABWY04_04390 [Arthrobacter sp.]